MSVTLIPEDDLRAAMRPYRVDPDTFEAGVRERVSDDSTRNQDPLANLSPALRSAAAFLPMEILTAGRVTGAAAMLAPPVGVSKLLSYMALPAISLFVLLGAAVVSVFKIRGLRNVEGSGFVNEQTLQASLSQWWRRHKWSVWLMVAINIAMGWLGATWLLFLWYIVSLAILVAVLTRLAEFGWGNRIVVGQSCLMGLIALGQVAGFSGIGDHDIHLIDQGVIVPVFFWGAFVIGLVLTNARIGNSSGLNGWIGPKLLMVYLILFAFITGQISISHWRPVLWPVTLVQLKAYVESFDDAPNSTVSWRDWELVASWTIQSGLDPDLSAPRRLAAEEITGAQNRFILGNAFRTGLVREDQLEQLREYVPMRASLLDDPHRVLETLPILSLEQFDWVIRAAVLHNDLTAEERDDLEKRLHTTIEGVPVDPYGQLITPLRVTQLLEVIGRPVDPVRYRTTIHDLLRRFHSKTGGGFQVAGGFKQYDGTKVQVGSLEATVYAIELMEIYGIPDNLDLNWVRSFLRPLSLRRAPEIWIAAAALERLNRLPGVTHPTWLQAVYYERSLLAALVLVALCIYATLASPVPRFAGNIEG